MRIATVLLLISSLLLPFSACDSPVDVPANRIISVEAIEDDPDFHANIFRIFSCPGTDDVLLFVVIVHTDRDALLDENNEVFLFHEHANVEFTGVDKEYPVLTVGPDDPDGEVIFPKSYYAVMRFHKDVTTAERLDPELRVVANGRYATTTEIRNPAAAPLYGEGVFPYSFGNVALGESKVFRLNFCQHCPDSWTLESMQLDDPAGVIQPDFPALPHRIDSRQDFEAKVNFRPTAAIEYQSTLTLNYRTESGSRFQSVYEFSGSGE